MSNESASGSSPDSARDSAPGPARGPVGDLATRPLWRPSPERVAAAPITRYLKRLEQTRGLSFADYESLWQWSVAELEAFWESVWQFVGVRAHSPYRQVLQERVMPGAKWFEGATLNFAERALARALEPDAERRPALVFTSERVPRQEVSWAQLAGTTGALIRSLAELGVQPGDRVVSFMPNIPQAVAAVMAVTARGAIWSSCSPDMGPVSVLDRFRQIEPRVLFAVDGYRYGGKDFDRRDVVRELIAQLPSLQAVIFVPYLDAQAALEPGAGSKVQVLPYGEATASPVAPVFTPVPFDHPLWIVYSSGTTGMPKPIVHGHGGFLLESLKSNVLQMGVTGDDRYFWFSSTNWVMWNLWVSTLMTGATCLQFDGNPGHPDLDTLWRFVERERATFFGTSPAFLGLCQKQAMVPRTRFDLSALRTIGCTGSPLTAEAYHWIYRDVHPDVLLASISGGTDPGAAFLGACPTLPIYAGEMQCRCLGCAVQSFDDAGRPLIGEVGELVVTEPMPSMPLYFWGDTDGSRYFGSYFDTYPGAWRHGDWLKLIERPESVTSLIFGRSDSTINRHGIRMGTSELYRVVESFPQILDSLVVDLEYLGRESFMALFVVLRDPSAGLSPALRGELLDAIRKQLSARHVPNDVFVIPDVPRTMSGKKLEVPVKRILLGHPVERAVNRDSMANPATIDWFIAFAKARGTADASG
jgi:acetoacetyl-CoA synthetase